MTSSATSAVAGVLRELAALFGGWDGEDTGPAKASERAGDRAATEGSGGAGGLVGNIAATDLAADDAFNRLALRIHEVQRASNPILRRFWDTPPGSGPGGGRAAGGPAIWQEIPPIPVMAFRDVAIVCGKPEAVFRTSGTSGGRGGRGEHHVPSLDLYRAAARGNYRRHLLKGVERIRVVSLIPDPAVVTDSSLARMAGFIAAEPEVTDTVWAFDPMTGVDVDSVRSAARGSGPVLLLTTAFSLVHLLDALDSERLPLPPGSRIMETGGFKGRVAEVDRDTLYARVERTLDVAASGIVNEYGMTELLSQAYDGVARQGVAGAHDHAPGAASRPGSSVARRHRFPPWVRTRALDPATLLPLPPGRPGLLAHFDLANAGSVCHILTEDLGCTTRDGGIELVGRAPGAGLRGCSLMAESFLRAVGR